MKASQLPNQLLFKIQLPVLSLSPHQIHVKKPNCLSVWEQPLVPETMSTTTIHTRMPGLSKPEGMLSKQKFRPYEKGKTNTKDLQEFDSELLPDVAGRDNSGLLFYPT